MQARNTRVVMFEMCGNDYLQARSNFNGQSGTCNYGVRQQRARQLHQLHGAGDAGDQPVRHDGDGARSSRTSTIPGYDADNGLSNCTDPATGQRVNKQSNFLPLLAQSNWRTCNLAAQYGFACVDSFARVHGRRLRLERRRPDRLGRAALPVRASRRRPT